MMDGVADAPTRRRVDVQRVLREVIKPEVRLDLRLIIRMVGSCAADGPTNTTILPAGIQVTVDGAALGFG